MLYSRDLVFGDGMTEITAPQTLEVFEVPKRKHREPKEMTTREILIIMSVCAPIMIGWVFATVMIRHELFYIGYWSLVWLWAGVVIYANTRRPADNGRRAKRKPHHHTTMRGGKVQW